MTSTDAERAWGALLRVHARLVPTLDRALQAGAGLSLAWYDVLLELSSAGGRLRMSELGERVVLSRTRVSRIVDELAAAGLVVREANPDDGRSSFALLTEEGRRRFRDAARVYRAGIAREIGGRLDPSAQRALAETLERLLDD
ncbi:MarR family winged helix-turn-helix transcriptional regulator [Naasia aerilata]|uniref:MarR family transcriptional regulator n=1 Tax=Naasia aerilata TaxID=1162966 RepID=A0ABM8G8A6_9MICO|nr:MarR family transcriptional regulator [Naasia aerilata]BDZ44406.1 MarR family transcriptional regulator [Naasia aerilata]